MKEDRGMMTNLRSGSVWQMFGRANSAGKFVFSLPVMLMLFLLIACVNNGDPSNEPPTQLSTKPPDDVVFTIGNLTDQTGVAASAIAIIDTTLDDMVDYYNEENLIPGVKLQIMSYDTQYDPALAKTGYERLKAKGADIIWTPVTTTIPILKPVADQDKFPIFAASANGDALMPPGYIFSVGTIPQYDAYTLLKWIAENDWDYKVNGPARIGGAGWKDDYSPLFFDGMKEYAKAHPDQFEWKGGYLTDFGFIWTSEIEALKDCDYIYPPVPMHVFVEDYRATGYKAKFIGTDPHAGFLDMIDKGNYWDEIDGMLFIRASRWWTEEGVIIDLTKELLWENHSSKAEEIMRSGVGYLSTSCIYQLLHIIRNAAENVGPENLDSQAVYDAAVTYTENIDGIDMYSFDETKRCSTNYYIVYEADGERQNLYRSDAEWLPMIMEP